MNHSVSTRDHFSPNRILEPLTEQGLGVKVIVKNKCKKITKVTYKQIKIESLKAKFGWELCAGGNDRGWELLVYRKIIS